MKASDIDKVHELIKQKNHLVTATKTIRAAEKVRIQIRIDNPNGRDEFIDLPIQLGAIYDAITDKINRINLALKDYGVDIEENYD